MKSPKETTVASKPTKPPERLHGKWYDDACGTAFALELVGERWSLLIIRELMFGPRRFSELRAGLPGISAKTLTERLDTLAQAGVLERRELSPPLAAVQVYELTEWGYQAEESIQALGRWAAASPLHDPTLPLSTASLMMSLRTMFDPSMFKGDPIRGGVVTGKERFRVTASKRRIRVRRGEPGDADFTIEAPSAPPIAALIYGKVPAAALADTGLRLTGNLAAAARFLDLFHLPEKAVLPPCRR